MEDTLERVDIQKLSDLVMRFLRAFERTLLKEMRNEQMQKQVGGWLGAAVSVELNESTIWSDAVGGSGQRQAP